MHSLIEQLCSLVATHGGADLFLQENRPAWMRQGSRLTVLSDSIIHRKDLDDLAQFCQAPLSGKEMEFAYTTPGGFRFRVNLFTQKGERGAVFRLITTTIPDFFSLGLPTDIIIDWISQKSGLVLVSGPAGSGKSTSVASSLEWMNLNLSRHIVTIEDPIEFLFETKNCLFSQREVGSDTESFSSGLRAALRQSPDVIMIGEIREMATALTALQAAEAGHLVIATLHASSVPETLERIFRLFSPDERDGISLTLANQLTGIINQRLISGINGNLVLGTEYLENKGLSRKLILEHRLKEIIDILDRPGNARNCSLLQSLVRLTRENHITEETAQSYLANPQEFFRAMKGIV